MSSKNITDWDWFWGFSFDLCIYFFKVYTISSNTDSKLTHYRKITLGRATCSTRVIFHGFNRIDNFILDLFEKFTPWNTLDILNFILYLIFDIGSSSDNFRVLPDLYMFSKLFFELGHRFCCLFGWSNLKFRYFLVNFLILHYSWRFWPHFLINPKSIL